MKRNRILVLTTIVIISFIAVLKYKKPHVKSSSNSLEKNDDATSQSSVSVSRNNVRDMNTLDEWIKRWSRAFSTPEIAHAMLTEQLNKQNIEQIISSVDDETLLNYFLQQKTNDDDINWKLYVAFMRRSLDADPKIFVKYLDQLKQDPGDSMVEDATALLLMGNQISDGEVIMEYFSASVGSTRGYPYFKKFIDSGYTYTQSLELLYEVYPLAAKMIVIEYFANKTYESFSRRDKSMIISRSEKESLIQFIQKNYKNDDMSDILTAMQELNVD